MDLTHNIDHDHVHSLDPDHESESENDIDNDLDQDLVLVLDIVENAPVYKTAVFIANHSMKWT